VHTGQGKLHVEETRFAVIDLLGSGGNMQAKKKNSGGVWAVRQE